MWRIEESGDEELEVTVAFPPEELAEIDVLAASPVFSDRSDVVSAAIDDLTE